MKVAITDDSDMLACDIDIYADGNNTYEGTPEFLNYIRNRYEASFDRSRLVSADDVHKELRSMLNAEVFV